MEEADNRKRIVRNMLMLYLRMLFNVVVSLVISRLILNALGVEDFGIYNVVGAVVVLFAFLNSAMASSTQRFLTFEIGRKNQERLHKVFSTSILIHALIAVVILILAETVGLWLFYSKMIIPEGRMTAAMLVYQLSVLSSLVTIMSVPYNSAIIAREKMDVFAYISMLEVSLRLVVVVALCFAAGDRLMVYAFLLFMVSLLIRGVYMVYCRRNIPEARFVFVWDRKLFSEMLHFAGWSMFGNLAYVGYTQGVNILLNMFFGPVVNAARAIAVQVQGTIINFCNSFQTALNPQITKSFAADDRQYMNTLVLGSSKFSFLLLLLMALPLMIETKQVLVIWLKIVPDHTVSFLRIILMVTMVDVLANPLITLAQATGRIRNYQLIVGGVLLMIVPLSYLALKLGGSPESVFVVHLCLVVVAQVLRLWLLRGLVGISLRRYFRSVVMPLMYVTFFSVIPPLAIYGRMEASLWRLVCVVAVSCLSVLFFGYAMGLSDGERGFVKNKVKYVKERIRCFR